MRRFILVIRKSSVESHKSQFNPTLSELNSRSFSATKSSNHITYGLTIHISTLISPLGRIESQRSKWFVAHFKLSNNGEQQPNKIHRFFVQSEIIMRNDLNPVPANPVVKQPLFSNSFFLESIFSFSHLRSLGYNHDE